MEAITMMVFAYLILRPWQMRTHCCQHNCFPICPCVQHLLRTNFVSGTQKMFLILFRNILCPQQMFPRLHSPRNIMDNNVSATMCPCLPGPLIKMDLTFLFLPFLLSFSFDWQDISNTQDSLITSLHTIKLVKMLCFVIWKCSQTQSIVFDKLHHTCTNMMMTIIRK